MTTQFILLRDINGINSFGPKFSDLKYSAALTQNTTASYTIPGVAQQWAILFSIEPGKTVWVANNATAEVPSGNTFSATTSELNPTIRWVLAGDVISFITPDTTAQVGIALYALQQ